MNALLQGKPSVDLPKDSKIAWVSTRRGEPAADQIAGHLHSSYLLHDMMRSLTAPLDELSTAHAVVLEAPSIVAQRFEHNMLNLIVRITPQCPHLAVIVQPSLRRKSNKTLWVSRWNRLRSTPFKFRQTCSCKMGNAAPGCHLALLVGTTMDIDMSPCAEVSTLSATPETTARVLGGTLFTLAASLLCGQRGVGLVPASLPPPALALCCRPATAVLVRGSSAPVGSQQTPDSAQTSGAVSRGDSAPIPTENSALLQAVSRGDSALTPGAVLPGNSALHQNNPPITPAYPTDAKVREKEKRQAEKDAGITRTVKKRKKIMEDHHDDCGEDLSSLQEGVASAFTCLCSYDTDDAPLR